MNILVFKFEGTISNNKGNKMSPPPLGKMIDKLSELRAYYPILGKFSSIPLLVREIMIQILKLCTSVLDPFHFDMDPDPDLAPSPT